MIEPSVTLQKRTEHERGALVSAVIQLVSSECPFHEMHRDFPCPEQTVPASFQSSCSIRTNTLTITSRIC